MIKEDEEQRSFTLFCVLDQKGIGAPQLWRTNPCSSSLVPPRPSSSVAPHPPPEPAHRFNFASIASLIPQCLNEAIWTRLIANMQETFTFTRKVFHVNDENQMNVGESSPRLPHAHGSNNSEDVPEMLIGSGSLSTHKHKCLVKSCSDPGASFGRDKMVKQRKSVSFDDDVMVYLFDQERPTMKLLSGPPSPLSDAYDCNLTEVLEEGLEWDDDFSAVEKSSHFQHGRRSASEFPTPPTPGRFLLSQRCLFLTHVTESDLTEL